MAIVFKNCPVLFQCTCSSCFLINFRKHFNRLVKMFLTTVNPINGGKIKFHPFFDRFIFGRIFITSGIRTHNRRQFNSQIICAHNHSVVFLHFIRICKTAPKRSNLPLICPKRRIDTRNIHMSHCYVSIRQAEFTQACR